MSERLGEAYCNTAEILNGRSCDVRLVCGHLKKIVKLIDFKHPDRSRFKVVNQYSVEEFGKIRCDMVVFVNELPLVVIELKSPSREETGEEDAYRQIKQYQQKCPSLFVYNAFSVISDMLVTKAGTITAPENRFMEWKSKNGDYESTSVADYETFFEGIFPKERFSDILQNYLCFDHKEGKARKVMGAYHQFFAVNKAVDSVECAQLAQSSKGGVFWHTQGSGKSFSMVFLVHKLLTMKPDLTVVVVTDRNDLDQQLYEQFAGCSRFIRQVPQRVGYELNAKGKEVKAAEGGRADLKTKLKDLETGGVIFTTIQKFEEDTGLLSDRDNIIVITDEAHRSQYGDEYWDDKAEKMKKGYALLLREALPHAVFVGFTGTPISERDRDTKEVFGAYIDVYDMTQSVIDGSTVKLYYESRLAKVWTNDEVLAEIDKQINSGFTPEEIIFCGYGEPTMALPVLLEVAKSLKAKYTYPLRLNTLGLGSLVWGRDITKELAPYIDKVNISLNATDNETWLKIVRPLPQYADASFDAMQDFIRCAAKHIKEVAVSIVSNQGIDEEKAKNLARSLGAKFFVREYFDEN